MATLTIRALDETTKDRLRMRAAAHGRSMEAEVRAILEAAVAEEELPPLGTFLRERLAAIGGIDLELPAREPGRIVELG